MLFFFLKLDDGVFHLVRVWNLIECEALNLGGGLDIYIAVSKKRWDDADDFGGYVLDFGEFQLRNIAVKKSFLADIDYAFIRDDPGVEIEVDPKNEKKIPDKKRSEAFAEKEKIIIIALRKIAGEKIEENIYQNQADDGGDDEKQAHQKYEPVPAQKKNHLLVIVLSRKVYFSKHKL